MAIGILDPLADGVPMPMISRQARLVISPHMGARYAVMNVVILAPGEKNDPHIHVASEDSMFLLSGSGGSMTSMPANGSRSKPVVPSSFRRVCGIPWREGRKAS